MDKENTLSRDLLILVSGLALILLANTNIATPSTMASKALETIGLAMAGYAPIKMILYIRGRFSERRTKKSIDRLFRSAVKIVSTKTELPIIIASDVEGCITPPYRTEVDLRKFQRLRTYCEFVKANPEFPQIIIFTGRSQGYVELLAQSLGMLNSPFDIPFVIENGAALYRPTSKKTILLLTPEQLKAVQEAQMLLNDVLPDNEFEPKTFMVTINPNERQTVDELREQVTLILQKNDLLEVLTIASSASAVDITPKNIDKLSGLKEVLKYYPRDRQDRTLSTIIALADHISDINVIKNVGGAYCPAENVHSEVRNLIEARFGSDHVINFSHIDFVLAVIEKECGIRII